ncbi:hypothetical protein [Halocynthiibacter styelae]|uniref:Uncharacterized protein n=1 Tax=Halocynthiibacter styelae TaxID=2761955 RepID=A0A8J7LPI6_9RHOB|nr:hypothetical protein [Paenihalocynthiibacter styelae]MBI1492872.1 hypothetical protein [Paenihalocynthiibacter styelae]
MTDGTSDLPIGTPLLATVVLPDGSEHFFEAWKEWLHRRQPQCKESEAFLLQGAHIEQVPIGADVMLSEKETG